VIAEVLVLFDQTEAVNADLFLVLVQRGQILWEHRVKAT
jgi:hypothetical protein